MTESGRSLPYGRQWIDEDDLAAAKEALESDFLTTGSRVESFEAALTAYTGAPHAAAVNSGTSALHAAYFACGLTAGDELITSPMTFAATANMALELGAKVHFADVDPNTGNIDPAQVSRWVSDKTKIIAPVDYTGLPADYDEIHKIAGPLGAKVVGDAAHSLGGTYKGRKVGTLADATALSFHPVKLITTGEGGAVMSMNAAIDEGARRFRSHGIVRNQEMFDREGPWFYEVRSSGLNYRITDFQCGLGLSQLKKLDRFYARRRQIVEPYWKSLEGFQSVVLPREPEGYCSGWHLFVLRLAKPDAAVRRRFYERLQALGMRVQVHYIPVHWHPRYQELGFKKGMCPNAEAFYNSMVSLPLFPRMTDSDIDWSIEQTIRAIKEVLE